MQSNNNAGIIIYRESNMPQILSLLSQPRLEHNFTVTDGIHTTNIFFFICPANGDKVDKRRYRRINDLVVQNSIDFLVERFEANVQSNVSRKKSEIHYTQLLQEIEAIKQLAALIKISQDRQENLLSGNIGFIMDRVDSFLVDLLTEEAANVMLYEGPALTEQLKAKLHNRFMEEKGVSIIFTKDIKNIIASSAIIAINDAVDLCDYKEQLNKKIVVGKSKECIIKSIHNIILWREPLNTYGVDSIPFLYNDEILAVLRYYDIKLDIIDFIKTLPYIIFDF